MSVITLTTDFGLRDGNVGVMKGVIWGIAPDVQIADISHLIQPQNIRGAGYVLARSATYFPKGTIHVVVTDPGVGTSRRPMAAQLGDWFYVGPDNGTISLLQERAERDGWTCEFIHLDRPQYWLKVVSHIFHGRDIFSPVAAHMANGVPLTALGSPFNDPVRLHFPKPEKNSTGWRGEVAEIDNFGNIASNIRVEDLGEAFTRKENIHVQFKDVEVKGMVNTFGERPVGELVALLSSTGDLILSVVNGNAAERLHAKIGDPFEATLHVK